MGAFPVPTIADSSALELPLWGVLQVPSKSPFAAPLEHMQRLMPIMEEQVASSEEVLTDLLDKLSDMVRHWTPHTTKAGIVQAQGGGHNR